ncbi:hypothetical protein [Streptomyces subrutilus]|uniref:Uncharacterized protein n=1 Tax=Streptomyces subrutilus TaxID=36818 RepID=A0A918QU54_9ACTN|nr:hypothetical protein [Streptomyces subrutilus]WSJ28085.1 hypothetical protein OG479_01585 [Streptomyces subrutilus]GGZ71030.1 hypothetical protein GCM10010371_33800 [Streptomyces subrutilus]
MPNSLPPPDDAPAATSGPPEAGSGPPQGASPASELLALLDPRRRSEPEKIPGQEPLF